MDTGICHAKGSPKRYMYKAEPHLLEGPPPDIMDTPVRVWNTDGSGSTEEMTLREFNRFYVVDHRFATDRVPSR